MFANKRGNNILNVAVFDAEEVKHLEIHYNNSEDIPQILMIKGYVSDDVKDFDKMSLSDITEILNEFGEEIEQFMVNGFIVLMVDKTEGEKIFEGVQSRYCIRERKTSAS